MAFVDVAADLRLRRDNIEAIENVKQSVDKGMKELSREIKDLKMTGITLAMPGINTLSKMVKNLGSFMSGLIMNNPVSNLLAGFRDALLSPFLLIKSAFTNVIMSIKSVGTAITDSVKSVFSTIGGILLFPFRAIAGLFTKKTEWDKMIAVLIPPLQLMFKNLADSINETLVILFTQAFGGNQNSSLDDLEAERDRRNALRATPSTSPSTTVPTSGNNSGLLGMLGGLLGGILKLPLVGLGVAIAAMLTGWGDEIRAALTGVIENTLKTIRWIIRAPGRAFDAMKLAISAGIAKFTQGPRMQKIVGFFSDLGGRISALFQRVMSPFKKVGDALRFMGGKIRGLLAILAKPLAFLGKLMRILRLNPITGVIFTLIDFVVGFFNGFKNSDANATIGEKLMNGIKGGIIGIIKGLTAIFDLIVFKLPGWILGWLGFEDMKNYLMNLDLYEIIADTFTWIVDTFKKIPELVDNMTAWMKGAFNYAVDIFKFAYDFMALKFEILTNNIKLGALIIKNAVMNMFETIANIFLNLKDRILLGAYKNLKFSLPKIQLKVPDWVPGIGGSTTTLLSGGSFGLDGTGSRAAAVESRMRQRGFAETGRQNSRAAMEDRLLTKLSKQKGELESMKGPTFVVAPTSNQSTSNSSSTIMNTPSVARSTDTSDGAVVVR